MDYSTNPKQAKQAWCGFLWQRRPSHENATLSCLLVFYKKAFAYISVDLKSDNIASQFFIRILNIVCYASDSFFKNEPEDRLGFVLDLVKKLDPNDRKLFSLEASQFFGDKEEDFVKIQWNQWLKSYWEERNRARPVTIDRVHLT